LSYRCLLGLVAALTACAQDASTVEDPGDAAPPPPSPPREDLGPVGTSDAFDVLTWNLEGFPKRGTKTLEQAARVLAAIQPDVVAVQEVVDGHALFDLAASMPGWEADVAAFFDPSGAYNPPVGMLWNTATVEVHDRYLLFEDDDHLAFPRAPLVLELTWRGVDFVVVNVHLKAMGDDIIQLGDPSDEEVRRLRACERLEAHLREHLPDARVVVVGDFNDKIEEPPVSNVFAAFLDRPGLYLFADMPIAVNPAAARSYPLYASHIDHVLITNELFPSYLRAKSFTRTVAVDRSLMSNWGEYELLLSDHRPVLLHLDGGED
jgi:endonuclease/exonuclease/phosphatase family metal-dependent hydrolase